MTDKEDDARESAFEVPNHGAVILFLSSRFVSRAVLPNAVTTT